MELQKQVRKVWSFGQGLAIHLKQKNAVRIQTELPTVAGEESILHDSTDIGK